jgi:hypothetical protein
MQTDTRKEPIVRCKCCGAPLFLLRSALTQHASCQLKADSFEFESDMSCCISAASTSKLIDTVCDVGAVDAASASITAAASPRIPLSDYVFVEPQSWMLADEESCRGQFLCSGTRKDLV